MAESTFQTLCEQDAIERIVETVTRAKAGEAPFALVLGAGFSYGLVPTARELVTESLPLWVSSLTDGQSYEGLQNSSAEDRAKIARSFWEQFSKQNQKHGLKLPLNPDTGIPNDYSDAYRCVFNPMYVGAAGQPAEARKFQRALMRLDLPRLNAAHFLLASLLGVQPGKTRKSKLFKSSAAFSRLILTTNFDPFLQTALQVTNRLYFMSDTPEIGVTDEILDDETDAIHLVYLHGSVHRRSQAASDGDIKALKQKNARTLAPVLKRHGVIVLGYSGWDDAIVEALSACDSFDHLLYWCGRDPDPLARGAFGPRVPEILNRNTAFYVPIAGAGEFMGKIYTGLVRDLPRLLHNPIGQLREMLDTIDLKELETPAAPVSFASNSAELSNGRSNTGAFVEALQSTCELLAEAERNFLGRGDAGSSIDESPPHALAGGRGSGSRVAAADVGRQAVRLLSSAQVAEALGKYADTERICTEGLGLGDFQLVVRAKMLILRGRAFYFLGKIDDALKDWDQLIEMPDAPIEQLAAAFINRGMTWHQKHEPEKELADYTRIIEQLPRAPIESVARALGNRGWTNYKRKEYPAFLTDTETALNLSGQTGLGPASFNLGLALLACGRDADALTAAARFPQLIESHGQKDIEDAKENWLTEERARPVIQLVCSIKT